MTAPLTPEDVRKVARLARLMLTDAEVETYTRQLGQVLGYVDRLSEVDTTGVEPMAHAIEMANVFRPDEPTGSLPRDAALASAPKTDGRYFLVPPILDGG
ncbi:MAG: Asp-tRNA(Asn)/Glu-tRNA(Gln) amidotransferase subunit GatC [Planctomycetaceae bacterium]|nr:Asp-tRNA(Asn)/Glu-tRNA(Gln) amidotransferase subunit GatC [Planctomycetaceae bacterium]